MPRSAGSILSEQHTVLRNGKAERIFAAALYEGFLHVISIASPEGGSAGGEGICVRVQHMPCRNVPGAPQGAGNLGAIGAKTRDPEGPRLTLHVFSPRRAQDGGRGQLPEPCLPAAAGWHGPVRLPTAGGAARNTGGIGPPLPAPERSRPRGANVPSNASPAGGAAQATWTALCICSVLQSTCRTRHCWRGPGPSGLLPCAGSGWAAGPCPPPRLTRLDTQEYPPDDSAGQDEASLRPGRGGGRRGHQQQGVPALHPGGAHGRTQLSRPLQRPTLTWLAGGARGLRLGGDEGASQVR